MVMQVPFTNVSEMSEVPKDVQAVPALPVTSRGLISENARLICQWVLLAVGLLAISTFGTVTNIINIICFVKQGLNDSVNVSLLGLAISDLACVATSAAVSISFSPAFQNSDLPFDAIEVPYMVLGWPHLIFARLSSWLTALIALERCLSLTMPLKVKRIITPQRVNIFIICVFVLISASFCPMYYANRFAMIFSPTRNRTILTIVYTEDRDIVEQISRAINSAFIPFSAFFAIIICTVVLVVKLRASATWRQKFATSHNAGSISRRDQVVAKMVVIISVVFIVSCVPMCVTVIAMSVESELSPNGRYINTLFILGSVSYITESANSSVNIFIYYHMSSRYRSIFRQIFSRSLSQNSNLDRDL